MNEAFAKLLMWSFTAAGYGVAVIWLIAFFRAAGRRDSQSVEASGFVSGNRAVDGAGRVMLGAAAGVAMGVVAGCSGMLTLIINAGGDVDMPELFGLAFLAIPVGLIACPGLVLWGTVVSWRVAERDPDLDAAAMVAAAGSTAGANAVGGEQTDALDAPFDPLDAPFDPPTSLQKPSGERDAGR
ncbi:hypothetical protein [Alienimonas chondri]|uniref:Uncharacterized protein n=1 Tax=Alienimonas chondri TaxID=2681879 RepID=A0ABX1VH80_9PLAN|nr:hypothetical protein [Alienimonas chondri]NNJ27202.1 hypothetical protein [Alienimonas chondri]